ncbi:hypothetical protein J6590_008528 [Homalodisca vitripennis]|nr:hypothetical protein J6590_008528 [Homalodisca vitripennis]
MDTTICSIDWICSNIVIKKFNTVIIQAGISDHTTQRCENIPRLRKDVHCLTHDLIIRQLENLGVEGTAKHGLQSYLEELKHNNKPKMEYLGRIISYAGQNKVPLAAESGRAGGDERGRYHLRIYEWLDQRLRMSTSTSSHAWLRLWRGNTSDLNTRIELLNIHDL